MIGWKANYGYALSLPTNLSQITFTDNNVPFTIITNPNAYSYITGWRTGVEPFNYSGITNLESVLGEDYYTIYLAPNFGAGIMPTYYSVISEKFTESSLLACPNLWKYFSKATGYIDSCIYIPALKKVIFGGGTILSVGENGSLTQMSREFNIINYTYANGTQREDYQWYFVWTLGCFSYDGTYESIINSLYILGSNPHTIGNSIYELRGAYLDNNAKNYYKNLFIDWSDPDINIPDNPYGPGGNSGTTDPELPPGTFDNDSDPIPDSPLPTLSAANTGFTRIYNPTLGQVQALARYLWTDESVIETIWNHIKQFFENPMEAIIGFNLVPVPVPDGGTESFALMYIDTGVQMTVAANQFVDLDCGTVELKRYYGSALDQSPYTKVSCFLPYIGTVNLNTDEVMGTTLQVKYRVDIVSGSCVAKIFVDDSCLYQYSGHCAITIPISSADFSSYVSAAISVGKLAAAAITAGAGAAMAVGAEDAAQQTNQVVTTTRVTNTARNPSTGRQITTGTTTTVETRESPADQSSTQASFAGISPQNVANTVGQIMSSKPHIEHSGSFSGNSGYLGVRRPFLIIERPNMCMPANYQSLNGFPSMITMELSTCKGFTRVQQVQLTGMGRATNPEQAEILELLKTGVIL